MVHVAEPELVEQSRRLSPQKALEKQIEQLKTSWRSRPLGDLETRPDIKDVKVLAARVDGMDRQQLRTLADSLRNKWKSAVVVLASAEDSNVSIVSAVTKDLTGKVHAGKLAGAVAQAVGGKGGGRPDMAEGGGKDASRCRRRWKRSTPGREHAVNECSTRWWSARVRPVSPAASSCRSAA